MDVKSDFEVYKDGEELVVVQTVTKRFSMQEQWKQLHGLEQELNQLQASIKKIESDIDNDVLKNSLSKQVLAESDLKEFHNKWNKVVEEDKKVLVAEMKTKISSQKKKRSYDRLKQGNAKDAVRNQILASVSQEYDFDVQHPLMMVLRQNFEGI